MYIANGFLNRTFASLLIYNYRLYFIGTSASLSGSWMQMVSVGWLAFQISSSGLKLGIVVALQFLPLLLFGMWGGVFVDRHNKRKILFVTQVAFFTLAILLGALLLTDMVRIEVLYIYACGLGLIRLFDNPARQAFVSEMVDATHVRNAVSLNSTMANLARVVGPFIGGLLIASVGLAFTFLVNAAFYLIFIFSLTRMRHYELHRPEIVLKEKGQVLEALKYVAKSPLIRITLILIAIIGTFAYEFQVSLPMIAEYTFDTGATGYAYLLGGMGAGSILGGLYSASHSDATLKQLYTFIFLFGTSLVVTTFSPTFYLTVLCMFIVGFFSINVTSLANTMIQLASAPSMRGRVMSLWSMAMVGSTPIGGPIIGYIGEVFGARSTLLVGGVVTLISIFSVIIFNARYLETE